MMAAGGSDEAGGVVGTIDGDYIDVAGAGHVDEIMAALNRVFGVPASAWDQRTYPVLRLGPAVEVVLDSDPDGGETARIAVAALDGDAGARRATAGRVYRELADTTGWELRWSSDEAVQPLAARDGSVSVHRN